MSAKSLSLLLALFSLQRVMLPTLGGLVLVSGIVYCGCAFLQRPPPSKAPRGFHLLAASEERFGVFWVSTGLVLVLLGALAPLPVLLALAGPGACWLLYRRGHVIAVRRNRLPKGTPGRIERGWATSVLLTLPFLLISYTGFAYAGVEGVEIYKKVLMPEESRSAGASTSSEEDRHSDSKRRFSYAELCRKLPDPQKIGYGLGDLFEHDGAVAAGCGEPALRVGDSTWVSPGLCGTELRSLGVVGEGREPVLLYGAPARLAWREAQNRNLHFAEASKLGGGEVALVDIASGTVAFARSSPALKPGRRKARRCEEIDEIARPFIELEPPLAWLWHEYMAAENTWIWPEVAEKTDDIVFQAPGGLPIYGSCEDEAACRLDGPGLHRPAEGPAMISLEQLELYAPASAGG